MNNLTAPEPTHRPKLRVLLTGASGAIGGALTARLLDQGFSVVGTYRKHPETLDSFARYGERFAPVFMDLLDTDLIADTVEYANQSLGGLDALVNVAGFGGSPEFLLRASSHRVSEVIAVNLIGPMLASKLALPYLIKRNASAVVNISSVAAIAPTPGVTAYSAAKAGLEGFTKALAREYGKRGLAASAVRLGPVQTPMLDALGEERVRALAASLPRNQLVSAEDIALALENILLQTYSGWLNGVVLTLDSGFTMWRGV